MGSETAGYWKPHEGGGWEWRLGSLPRGWGQWHKSRQDLTDHSKTPDGAPAEQVPTPAAPTGPDPTPHGGYWHSLGRNGGWEWVNTVDPKGDGDPTRLTRDRVTHGQGESFETLTDPYRSPDGRPNKEFNRPSFPDGTPNSHYQAPDVNSPTLTFHDSWPRDLIGAKTTTPAGGPKVKIDPPSHPAWHVNGASLREGEHRIMSVAQEANAEYESLRDQVAADKGWIFAAHEPEELEVRSGHHTVHYDKTSGVTNMMSAAADNVLLNIADAIQQAGIVVKALDAAGQVYSRADMDSFPPEA